MKTQKIRITSTKDFKGKEIRVFKSDFGIYDYMGGYFGITLKGGCGGNCVFAGDSAWEDSYNEDLMKDVLKTWNGVLIWAGDNYGYKIEL